jgi:hypothetical protein
MAVKFTNNAKTTLASSLTNVATSASVVDGSVFPTLGAGEYFYCTFDDGSNNEIVKVTARSGNTLTIVRGVDNTTARAFSSGDAAELRATAGLLTDIQENIAAKSANQTVYNTTTASSATDYDIGIDPSVEANAMVFLNGVMQHHDTFSFSGSTLTFDTAPSDGMALEVIVDNLINLQSSNLTVDTFTAADVGGNPQTDFTLSDSPAAETNLIVFVDGVFQDQDAYTISTNVLTMTDGVIADRVVTVYVINPVNIGTPSDGTVTSAKLSGNITMPANLTVTGDVAFDSPTFVVDNANSRVGIGTASPSTLLDIVGDVKMSAGLQVSGIDYPTSDGTNGQVLTTDGAGTLSFSTISGYTDSDVETYLNTSTIYTDATNDRLGIGTSSPQDVLHVKNSTQAVGDAQVILEGRPAGYGTGISFQAELTGGSLKEMARIVADGSAAWNTTTTTQDARLRFFTTNDGTESEKMVISHDGNVGIGTSSPASMIHLSAGVTGVSGGEAAAITLTNKFDSPDNSWTIKPQRTGVSNTGLEIRDVTDSRSDMSFDGSGNVGIGTSSPQKTLDVTGSLAISNSTTSYWDFDRNNSTGDLYVADTGTDRIVITTAGDVQLGTSLGNSFYNGVINAVANKGSGAIIKTRNGDGNDHIHLIGDSNIKYGALGLSASVGSADVALEANLNLRFNTGGTNERMRIDSSGNMLVGTTSNSRGGRAVINGSAGDILKLSGGASGYLGLYITQNQANNHIYCDNLSTAQFYVTTSTGDYYFSGGSLSDRDLKENIASVPDGSLDLIKALTPRTFNFKAEENFSTKIKTGFIAQEVAEVITEGNVATGTDGQKDMAVDTTGIVAHLVKAIQEQQTIIDDLKARIETLENA